MLVLSPYLKVFVSGLSAAAYWRAFTPPNAAAKLKGGPLDGIFGYIVRHLSYVSKILVCGSLLCQMAIILALDHPAQSSKLSGAAIKLICPNPTILDATRFHFQISQLAPAFILGCTMMTAMSLLRVWCFRTLARLFTFEVTILDSHRLIQSGPYAYVRHPGYTAQILLTAGVYIMGFSRGGWITECQVTKGQGFYWVWSYIALSSFGMHGLYRRGEIEDRELEKAFGEAWIDYSKKVPYSFVPGLL